MQPRVADWSLARQTVAVIVVLLLLIAREDGAAQTADVTSSHWQYGAFADFGYLVDVTAPSTHVFRNRGTTPRLDEFDVNMAGLLATKTASADSPWAAELTVHAGRDSETFGFSATAPNLRGSGWLRHLGPTNVTIHLSVGGRLRVQGGIFSSLIGYDSLYAKDNFSYTRPWGADYTPYLMLGVNASYPFNEATTASVAVINGYWHLAHANNLPNVVGQISRTLSDRLTLKQTILYGPHQSNTALAFWRVLSDTIVERKGHRLTSAFEYQVASEKVDAPGGPRALWTSAQLPLHWAARDPVSVTVRPEFAWDRDGRWIGAPQSVEAVTTTVEVRLGSRKSRSIVRLEHRYDNSHGKGGGFFTGAQEPSGDARLTPTQHLLAVGLILTFDSGSR